MPIPKLFFRLASLPLLALGVGACDSPTEAPRCIEVEVPNPLRADASAAVPQDVRTAPIACPGTP